MLLVARSSTTTRQSRVSVSYFCKVKGVASIKWAWAGQYKDPFTQYTMTSSSEDMIPSGMVTSPVNINLSRWDQATFTGRLNHFIRITNPFLSLKTENDLNNAKRLVEQARSKLLHCASVYYTHVHVIGSVANGCGQSSLQLS